MAAASKSSANKGKRRIVDMIDSGGVRVRSIFWDEGNHAFF
jgi:hypothetical protein